MDRDGSNPQRITHDDERKYYPAWSPDGTKIAYQITDGIICWVALNDGQAHHVANGRVVRWSPDSRKLVYGAEGDPIKGIAVYDLDTKVATGLSEDGWYPVWLKSGEIAFLTSEGITLMSENGNVLKTFLPEGGMVGAPFDWFDPAFAVSPLGRRPVSWGGLKNVERVEP